MCEHSAYGKPGMTFPKSSTPWLGLYFRGLTDRHTPPWKYRLEIFDSRTGRTFLDPYHLNVASQTGEDGRSEDNVDTEIETAADFGLRVLGRCLAPSPSSQGHTSFGFADKTLNCLSNAVTSLAADKSFNGSLVVEKPGWLWPTEDFKPGDDFGMRLRFLCPDRPPPQGHSQSWALDLKRFQVSPDRAEDPFLQHLVLLREPIDRRNFTCHFSHGDKSYWCSISEGDYYNDNSRAVPKQSDSALSPVTAFGNRIVKGMNDLEDPSWEDLDSLHQKTTAWIGDITAFFGPVLTSVDGSRSGRPRDKGWKSSVVMYDASEAYVSEILQQLKECLVSNAVSNA